MAQKYIHLNDKVRFAERFYRNHRQACIFIADELRKWDLSEARWFRLVDVDAKASKPKRALKGAWGTSRHRYSRLTGQRIGPVSINCNVYGDASDFPNPTSKSRRPDGKRYAHAVLDMDRLLVFIAAHELWHYLCMTGQLNCNNDERHADAFADVMVYKFGGEPVRR